MEDQSLKKSPAAASKKADVNEDDDDTDEGEKMASDDPLEGREPTEKEI